MTCNSHNWVDITTVTDGERKFMCASCPARTTQTELDNEERARLNRAWDSGYVPTSQRRRDGWDGMRRFLTQMDEGRTR
jgi:hypothetical protein